MNQFRLEVLQAQDKDKYNTFLSGMEHAMIYHTWNYKELIKDLFNVSENYLIALDTDDYIVGVLPLIYKDGKYGRIYNSLPFYGSNGGVLTKSADCFDFLIQSYNEFVEDSDLSASTVITNPLRASDNYDNIVGQYKDYRIGQFSSIEFEHDHENGLMESFHYKTRNVIRKAIKESVTVSIDNLAIDFLYQTHVENMLAIGGKPKPQSLYEKLPNYFKAGVDYQIYIGKIDDKPIAALLLFYFNGVIEYYTPVINEKYRSIQPLSLLIYTAMSDASKLGYKKWNWGGTWATQDGVYSFKKRWGTYDVNYYYHTFIKDDEILNATKEELLTCYDNFFVVAFNHLKNK